MNKFKQIILTLLLCATGMNAWAYSFVKDGIYYNLYHYVNSDSYTAEVTYKNNTYNSYSGDVVIPETVTSNGWTYPVTSISNNAFKDCTGLTSVTIPNSVTHIGYWVFEGCTGLTSVTIPNSVTYIGINVFAGCTGLASVTIPNSVTEIGYYAFKDCIGLTSITIPNSVTIIGGSAFKGCTGLNSVTIPNSVTTIGWSAFEDCTNLTSVTIPNSVTSVYGDVYHNTGWYNNQPDGILYLDGWCLGYKGEKPEGILSIEEETIGIAHKAFYDCTDITSVTIPNSVTLIGNSAFYGCTGLTSVTIPNSVTLIGESAFYGCTSLITVTIPNSVTTIGWSAFEDCTSLTSVTIPNSVTSVGGDAYHNTGWYNNQPDGILYLDGWCLGYKGEKPVGILSIEEGTIGIAHNAFYDCTGLTSVTIPNTVTTIGNRVFMSTGLTSVTIPNSVNAIESYAFSYCTNLTSVTIPNSVTSIGQNAFYGCAGLISVTIGNSVTSIGSYAFEGCSSLDTIIALGTTPPTLGGYAFSGISSEAVLFVPCGTTTSYSQQFNMFDPSNIYEECNPYPVTINPTGSTGGEISVSANSAQLGENVEVYVTLEDGYAVESIVAYNANNPSQIVPISLAGAKDVLTYSFVMMPFPVNVEATFRSTEGVSETDGGNIATMLYPNPTNGKVTIEAENMRRVSVFNIMGQKVLESTAEGNSFECDMSRYGVGVYMMQIETSNGIATKRVVVR